MDIDQIRSQFPGTSSVTHLIASGAGLMPLPVTAAMSAHLELEQRLGGYEAHAARADELDAVYADVASLLNAQPEEIALLENATAAWCQAFYALPLKAGDRILTCEAEYAANYVAFLQRKKRDGIVIDVIPGTASGELDVQALEQMIDERVKLIAITWIPTNGGLVNPAEAVGRVASERGIPYLLDACQAIGQMPVDVQALRCDFLSATGRKFLCGPRGTGFLYIRKPWVSRLEPAMIDHFAAPWVASDRYELREDARRFENWENSYALRAGLGAAIRHAMSVGLERIQERAWELADYARTRIADIPGATVHDLGQRHCAIVSFTINGLDPAETVQSLRVQHINIGASQPSSTRLDAESRNLPALLRVAPHYYNTSDEIDVLIQALNTLRD
ncbi:aminotransferase class V-fold PLP-dependent enzyme [Granulosicoccus sp. 3-233]|uniref:aminotransferase class V-fold PLP-dependent enzyme n=1 Tax=Granulosicoccus sp. 3-233 TaxID=3417969 RepID=UPI003D33B58A